MTYIIFIENSFKMMMLRGYKVTSSENQLVTKYKKVTNEARKHKKDE